MPNKTYSCIVVGKGLLGAAAARYLSAQTADVAIIGPDEPADRYGHNGVFASHYDEGRITRILDRDRLWALLAKHSIARYRDNERLSGIPYYHEVGHLYAAAEPVCAQVRAVGTALGVSYEDLNRPLLAARFPYLRFAAGISGLYQAREAGYINPRAQIRAQLAIAQTQGTTVLAETVRSVRPEAAGMTVETLDGSCYRAEQVLIAAGGFSNVHQLLPHPLPLTVYARTVLLAELDPADLEWLKGMPSVIHKPDDPADNCYILPPIRYPDGKTYLKIGAEQNDPTLTTLGELTGWFQSRGAASVGRHLEGLLGKLLPALRPRSVHTDSCVTSYTTHGYPYIDRLGERLGVLTGGCGGAAKSADELGRLGAQLMLQPQKKEGIGLENFAIHPVSKE